MVASGGVNESANSGKSKPVKLFTQTHNKTTALYQLTGSSLQMRLVPSRPTRRITPLKVMLLLAMFFAPEFAAAGNPRKIARTRHV